MSRTFAVLSTFLVALSAMSLAGSRAEAAPYSQILCYDPETLTPVGRPPAPVSDLERFEILVRSDCEGGFSPSKGITVSPDTRESQRFIDQFAGTSFRMPADVRLVRSEWFRTLDVSASNTSGWGFGWGVGAGKGELFEWQDGSLKSTGRSGAPFAPENRVVASDGGRSDQLRFYAGCTSQPTSDGGQRGVCDPSAIDYRIFGGRLTLDDSSAPVVTSGASGSFVEASELKGTAIVKARAADSGSGVYRLKILVDEVPATSQVLDENGGTCRDVVPSTPEPHEFASAAPCPLASDLLTEIDTRRLPEGQHDLRLVLEDAAGNEVVLSERRATVDNVPTPNAGSDRQGVRVRLGRRVLTLRYGQRSILRGRLVDSAGKGIAGAHLDAGSRVRGSGESRVVRPVRTDARGRFAARVAPGPSRTLSFRYRPDLDDPQVTAGSDLVTRVRARVTLQTSRRRLLNGQSARFSGRLSGSGAEGRLIDVQGRAASGWRTACRARTRKDGRFSCHYRFGSTQGIVRYRMRALVPRQTGLRYEPGTSRTTTVRVRGL